MKHLRWRIENTAQFRPDGEKSEAKTLRKESFVDVWVSPSQVWYRIEVPVIDEDGTYRLQVREILCEGNYAAYQDYNTGQKEPYAVSSIRAIPAYGPSREWDVCELQYPYDNLWIRSLFLGAMPKTYDGLPVYSIDQSPQYKGQKLLHKNFGETPETLLHPASKLAIYYVGEAGGDGKVQNIIEHNGWGDKPLRSFCDLKWEGQDLVGFGYQEDSIQAQRLTVPRLTMTATRVVSNEEDSPVKFKEGARVFDYRLCKPVPLNDFPDKSCPAKTYKFSKSLKTLAELKGADEAKFPDEPVQHNSAPIWLYVLIGVLLVCGITLLLRKKKHVA